MAWTETTRAEHDRCGLRYASDTTDEERAIVGPFLERSSMSAGAPSRS